MRAMILERARQPLRLVERPVPRPEPHQVLIRVRACGVCRTDLHVFDGDLTEPNLPLVLGHEIVGAIVKAGARAGHFQPGQRVGVPWLGGTCGHCSFCRNEQENLCDSARFTGYQLDGGYAEYAVADHRYTFPIAAGLSDAESAPLLCAGLIGYRSLRLAGDAHRLGLYGFGAAAHIIAQVACHQGREVYAFTRPGDIQSQDFARRLGALWAGDSTATAPVELDAAILFAPVGGLIPLALGAVRKGGTVVCAGIHMSQIPAFDYGLLWGERSIRSVANLTRRDGLEFLALAPQIPVQTEIRTYRLEDANAALDDLRAGKFEGAAVLCMDSTS
jgi:propanol-preferring alcohol dehydrogenase